VASNRPSVLKRQRERKRAERASEKRELRVQRGASRGSKSGAPVATRDDLADYGVTRPPPDAGPTS
jgi:hypothetical protein